MKEPTMSHHPKQPGKDGKKRRGAAIILALCAASPQAIAETSQATPTAATAAEEDAWVARLGAWADEFEIPADVLPRDKAALLALQELNLYHDDGLRPNITWLPSEIGQLQQLQKLVLWGNQLSSLPAAIGQLQQLQVLYLGSNQLSTLPAVIWQLQQLQVLDLVGNQLSSLPAEIGQLQQLQYLTLSNNPLSTLPEEIGQLRQLVHLDIKNNPELRLTPAQEQFLQGLHM